MPGCASSSTVSRHCCRWTSCRYKTPNPLQLLIRLAAGFLTSPNVGSDFLRSSIHGLRHPMRVFDSCRFFTPFLPWCSCMPCMLVISGLILLSLKRSSSKSGKESISSLVVLIVLHPLHSVHFAVLLLVLDKLIFGFHYHLLCPSDHC